MNRRNTNLLKKKILTKRIKVINKA